MSLEEVQQKAIETYQNNLEFFKTYDNALYRKVFLLQSALDNSAIETTIELEYKEDNYFDMVYLNNNNYFYNQNSITYSEQVVKSKLSFESKKDSFKTFYEYKFSEDFYEKSLSLSPYLSQNSGNSPIVHYIQKNSPKDEVQKEIFKFMIFGVGLGIHLSLIQEIIKAKLYLIIEPNLEIFRLSMFVTDYKSLAKNCTLVFSVASNEIEFKEKFEFFYQEMFISNHYLKFFMFYEKNDFFVNIIQNFLVSQAHILYPYPKVFESFSRSLNLIEKKHRVLNISKIYELEAFSKPILFLAAGPSLQKNLDFVKKNQDKFLVVAVYSIMPLLEKEFISPDIITQYDQKDETLNVIDKIKNIEFFKDTIFLLAAHVPQKLLDVLKDCKIYLFQGKSELKRDFGFITSPSIGEITYALLLMFGARRVYLLGLDMAMDPKSGKTHIDGHDTLGAFEELKEEYDNKNFSFRGTKFKVKGNFTDFVDTTAVFNSSIKHINLFTKKYKGDKCEVFNLSNGAFFESVNPLRTEELEKQKLEPLKIPMKILISENLDSISENGFNNYDLGVLEKKVQEAYMIKKEINNFSQIKNSSFDNFKKNLLVLLQNILFKEYFCKDDLIDILMNFTYHIMGYVFYFTNLKVINNPKKHIKVLTKNISLQYEKLVDGYLKELEEIKK